MKKILLTLTAIIAFGFIIKAQNVTFNDLNLKQRIVLHGQSVTGGVTGPNISIIDTDNNGEISIAEAQAYTGRLYLNQNGSNFYTDLTGVEEFTAITELFCENNQMTTLSVSAHPDLTALYCDNNQISSINLSANTDLEYLDMGNNDLTTLDLSSNTNIETVVVDYNSFTSIDISTVTSLEQIDLSFNPLVSIVLPISTNLFYLNVAYTNLSSLDISSQTGLTNLYVKDCPNLSTLNLANGSNSSLGDMYAQNNSSLSCIQVDDPIASAGYPGWIKDVSTNYNIDCTPPTRYYVDIDATGNNDGSSWVDAFTDLQNAFNNAYVGMEIWVADGTYKHAGTNRNLAFLWEVDSLEVYGGFNGTETMLGQRNWMINRTIMSGDIGTQGDIADNCYAVFVGPFGSSTNPINYALLDGFIIQDGNANDNVSHEFGGTGSVFYSVDYTSQMDFHNCEFSNNTAKYSAFFAFSDTKDVEVNVDACIFKNNSGRVGSAILAESHGENMLLNVTNSLFYDNESKDMGSLGTGLGSVVYLEAKNAVNTGLRANFINSTFVNNINSGTSASNFESTIVCYDAASGGGSKHLDVDNCIFWGNIGDSYTVRENPNSNSSFNSIGIDNTLSEFNTFPTIATTSNILTSNPMFTNIGNDDFTLQSGSPAIDAGSQTGLSIPNLDLAGNTRVNGSAIDMGCYEKSCAQYIFQITENNGVLSAPTNFVSYQWSFDGNDISGATTATYTPTQPGLYTLEVSDGNCPKTTTYFFCGTQVVTISESNGVITAPSGYNNYDWYQDGNYLIAAGNTDTLAVTQDGSYYCEVLFGNGLNSCVFTTNTINVCSSVTVDITESNGILTATAGYSDYQWFKDGVAITGAMNDIYEVTEDGNYSCDASENGCTASSNTITISISTAIRNVTFENISVYPNPTNGNINLKINEELSSIRLFDLTGKVIKTFNLVNRQLNIAEFTKGIYFLEIANAESKSVVKVIKN